MANDINRVCIVGRFTREPELKFTPSNIPVASFTLANNRSYTTDGAKKESASYFNCVCWGKGGQIISQYMKRGSRIIVEGRLQQRSWEDKDSRKRSIVEIVVENFQFLDGNNKTSKEESVDSHQSSDSGTIDNFDDYHQAEL